MITLAILIPILFVIFIVVIVFAVVPKFTSGSQSRQRSHSITDRRGNEGESYIKSILGESVHGERYIIHDYIFQKDYILTQIDHLVVNNCGIFVIETKNMVGNIFGNDTMDQWTQICDDGRVRNFENPVKQNEKHVNVLKSVLSDIPIYSIVVFVQDNTENIQSDYVVPTFLLNRKINSEKPALNERQMKVVYESLERYHSTISHEEYVQIIKKYRLDLDNNICPRCGGNLVLRSGQYGQFYGCSNYPKCKFKKKN